MSLTEEELEAIANNAHEDGWCAHDVSNDSLRAIFKRVEDMRKAKETYFDVDMCMPTAFVAENGYVCTHRGGPCQLPVWLKNGEDGLKFLQIMQDLVQSKIDLQIKLRNAS